MTLRRASLALFVALIPAPLFAGGGPGGINGYGNVGLYAGHGAPGGGGLMPGNGSPFVPKGQPWILQAAPWYLYWPYDAHFQTAAPVFAPYQPPHLLGAIPPQAAYPGYGPAPYGFGPEAAPVVPPAPAPVPAPTPAAPTPLPPLRAPGLSQ